MTRDDQAEKLRTAFERSRSGDANAFAEWMGMVELPLRRSLGGFAHAVDVEVVVQETFLRMWLVVRDQARRLEGENASLRFALRVARNVAHEELRQTHLYHLIDEEELNTLPEFRLDPEFPDPALRKAIAECMDRLPAQPKAALSVRIRDGHLPDRSLAEGLRMRPNTFLQNIVRARKLMAACLEKRGVRLERILS
jgi:DNA-directed RNA polymerase specialized sigma24 family protein